MQASNGSDSFGDRLDRAREGDRSTRGRLLAENRSWLKRAAGRALGPKIARRHDASDLAQECLLVADRKLDAFRGRNAATFRAWLKGIQRKLVCKLLGRQLPKIQREVALPCDSAAGPLVEATLAQPLDNLVRHEQLDLFREALAALSEEDLQLIDQKFLQTANSQTGYDELALTLNTNAAQLRQRVCRILKRLETGMALLEQLNQHRVAPHYRQILCWRHFRAWPASRIATELGCEQRAAKTLLKRAEQQLASLNIEQQVPQ